MMNERDIIYGGYCQNLPGNMQYGNFGYQAVPGTLIGNSILPNMINGYQDPNFVNQGTNNSNTLMEINTRLNNLETRVRLLEQRIGDNNSYQDDNSMHMI